MAGCRDAARVACVWLSCVHHPQRPRGSGRSAVILLCLEGKLNTQRKPAWHPAASLWLLAAVLGMALATLPLRAQESTGSLTGVVTDVTGASVPGAKVTVTGPRLPLGQETTSGENGTYNFLTLPVGTYAVTVTKEGFQTLRQQNVEVRLGSTAFNPKLAVGQVSEVVEVTDNAIALDVTSTRVATTITEENIQRLPTTSRNFSSLLTIAPGVRAEVKGGNAGVGGFSVDGASGSENTYFIDGSEVSDVRRGSLGRTAAGPVDFFQEINVRSSGFEAEYGGATGGVINVITRSGQNAFHGSVFTQFTSAGLNASDRGYWQRSPVKPNAALPGNAADYPDFFKPREDKYSIWFPGFSLGGRIIRDRLFFFSGYSPELERTRRINSYASGDRTYDQEQLRHYLLNRLDYNVTSKIQAYGSWQWSPSRRTGTLPNRDVRVAAPTNDLSIQGGYTPSQTVAAGVNYAASSRLLLSFRYGYRYLNSKDGNYGISGAPFLTYQTTSVGLEGVPAELQRATAYSNVTSTLLTEFDITTRKNFYVDASYVANFWGQHTFKAGYAINQLGNEVRSDYSNGRFLVFWDRAFNRANITNQRGTYGYYTWEDGVRQDTGVSSRNQGFYLQDSWRPNSRLTLNLGVRFENEFLPPYREEQNGIRIANPISFNWGDKIAPRLGVAWNPTGDGRWKIAGSFGLFYDTMKYELARGSFGGDVWFTNVYRLDSPNVLNLSRPNPGVLGPAITRYNNRTVPINEQGELEGIDPAIKPYASRDFTVLVERQLASRLTASLRYTRKDLLRGLEDIGVLDEEGSEVYLIGNPGFGETRNTNSVYGQKTPNGQEFLVPEAKRQYDAVEFRIQGQLGNLTLIPSYTWSRLYGNYSGLANSDESGRSDPGVSRAYDLPYYYFDASGSQRNVYGLLGTDRPHTFKFFGNYLLRSRLGATNVGLSQFAYSGTPDTTTVIYLSAPTTPFGRGDLGRTPAYTQTDLAVQHDFGVREGVTFRIEAQVRNLFNQGAVISRTTQLNYGNTAISDTQLPPTAAGLFAGYDPYRFVQRFNTSLPLNPIYGLPGATYNNGGGPGTSLSSAFAAQLPNFGAYQDFRTLRLGVKLIF